MAWRCRVVCRCQHFQGLQGVRVMSPEPHESLSFLCQRRVCGLLLVVAWEPSVAGWSVNSLPLHEISLGDRDVPPGLFRAVVSSVMAEAEVGDQLAVVIRTLPASHTLKSNGVWSKVLMDLNISQCAGFLFILTWVKRVMLSFKECLLSCSDNGKSLTSCEDTKKLTLRGRSVV